MASALSRLVCSVVPIVALATGTAAAAGEGHWPSFRGPRASGIAPGAKPPTTWNGETGDGVAWKTPIPGLGHSSPVIWGDRLFVTTAVAGGEAELKVGLYGDGRSAADRGPELEVLAVNPLGETAMATPAISGDVLYFRTRHHVMAIAASPTGTAERRRPTSRPSRRPR